MFFHYNNCNDDGTALGEFVSYPIRAYGIVSTLIVTILIAAIPYNLINKCREDHCCCFKPPKPITVEMSLAKISYSRSMLSKLTGVCAICLSAF